MVLLHEAIGSATGSRTGPGSFGNIVEHISATASATGITPEIAIDKANEAAKKKVDKLLNPDLKFYYNRNWSDNYGTIPSDLEIYYMELVDFPITKNEGDNPLTQDIGNYMLSFSGANFIGFQTNTVVFHDGSSLTFSYASGYTEKYETLWKTGKVVTMQIIAGVGKYSLSKGFVKVYLDEKLGRFFEVYFE